MSISEARRETRDLNAKVWARSDDDYYREPSWVSARLFEEIPFFGDVLDPACGKGTILRNAAVRGLFVHGSDIANRTGCEMWHVADFFAPDFWETFRRYRITNIVSNPPFDCIEAFAKRALLGAEHRVALIFPTRRLNAAGAWLRGTPLARILYLTPRPSMPPGAVCDQLEADGKTPSGGKEDFCWLVWERGHRGDASASWLHRDEGGIEGQ